MSSEQHRIDVGEKKNPHLYNTTTFFKYKERSPFFKPIILNQYKLNKQYLKLQEMSSLEFSLLFLIDYVLNF